MKNFIIFMWVVFAAFFLFPVAAGYMSGSPESEIVSIIEKESEADDIKVTATEEHGNKSMYGFTAGKDFGVAVFTHFGDNYKYQEGTMSNDEEHIDVNLDTGWDVYEYKVTAEGAQQVAFHRFGGIYKVYVMIAAVMVIFSIAGGIYAVRLKKKHEEQRKKA